MSTIITRTHIFNDSGAGLDGTVLDDAWKLELYDQIDALFSSGGLDVTGVADLTGLKMTATGMDRAAVLFRNVTTGALGIFFFGNDGGVTIRKQVGGNQDLLDVSAAGVVTIPALTSATWTSGAKYVVVDASGNILRSALGPAS